MNGPIELLLLGLLGVAVGGMGSMLGVGGGFIVVPLLHLLLGFTPGGAAGTSLLVVLVNAVSGTIAYLRLQRVDNEMGLLFSVCSIPGSVLGAVATMWVSGFAFKIFFAFLLIFSSIYLFLRHRLGTSVGSLLRSGRRRRLIDKAGREYTYIYNRPVAALSSVFAGFIAGFFGVGGGIVNVPIMIILFGVPAHVATATSQFILIFTASSGLITHSALGNVDPLIGGVIAAGAIAGAQLGAETSERMSGRLIERLFAILLIAIAMQLLIQTVAP